MEGVPQGLRKLQEEVTELNERLKAQSAKLYEFLAPQLLAQAAVDEGGIKYVATAQEDCSAADARLLLNKLLADGRTVAAVVYRSGERINFVLGSGEQTQADCRSLCRKAGELFGGRPHWAIDGCIVKTAGVDESILDIRRPSRGVREPRRCSSRYPGRQSESR